MNISQSISKKEKKKKTNVVVVVFCFFIFLSSMNFINNYFYFLFFAFAVLFILGIRTFRVNGFVVALTVISVSYLAFYPDSAYSITGIIKQFVYPLSYLCGLNCLKLFEDGETEEEKRQKIENGFLVLCYVIATGILVHVILNLYSNQGIIGREINDFWGGASSATCNAAMFCFGIGMIPALLINKSGAFGKIFAVVNLVSFVLFALILAGRTFFVLFLIVFLLSVLFKAFRSKNFNGAVSIIFIVALVCVALIFLYQRNKLLAISRVITILWSCNSFWLIVTTSWSYNVLRLVVTML